MARRLTVGVVVAVVVAGWWVDACAAQTLAWTRETGTSVDDCAHGIAVDGSGNAYVAGYSQGSLNGQPHAGDRDIVLLKYDVNGTLEWTRETGTSGYDRAYAIAVDGSGNAYVAGYSQGSLNGQPHAGSWDIVALKYNSTGSLEWTRETGTGGDDYAYVIAVDGSGNAYVAGYSDGSLNSQPHAGGDDIVVLKYNSTGSLLWTRETGTSGYDHAGAIAVDGSGNAYVAGYSDGSLNGQTHAGGYDIVVLKYDVNGTLEWTRETGTSGHDYARGIAVDSSGNAYVAGYAYASLNGQPWAEGWDIVVLKYSTSGGLEWTRETGTSSTDLGQGIAVDSSGNAYVAGYSGARGYHDIVVLKYTTSGGLEWTRETGSSGDDIAYGIAVDSSGNAYVAGYSGASLNGQPHAGDYDIVVLKYNTSGGLEWTRETGTSGIDYARGIAVDGSGNAYVAGYSYASLNGQPHAGNCDIVMLKYTASGGLEWTRETGTSGIDYARGIAVDGSGNAYVAGYSYASLNGQPHAGNCDIVVLKYCAPHSTGPLCSCLPGSLSGSGRAPCAVRHLMCGVRVALTGGDSRSARPDHGAARPAPRRATPAPPDSGAVLCRCRATTVPRAPFRPPRAPLPASRVPRKRTSCSPAAPHACRAPMVPCAPRRTAFPRPPRATTPPPPTTSSSAPDRTLASAAPAAPTDGRASSAPSAPPTTT